VIDSFLDNNGQVTYTMAAECASRSWVSMLYSLLVSMGIYAAHGVEYHIVLLDGTHKVVLSQDMTDDRLIQSKYFRERKDVWFNDVYKKEWCVLLGHEVISMTREEVGLLQQELAKYKGIVDNHGWYNVNAMSSTYG
jgi:hypothetical protein